MEVNGIQIGDLVKDNCTGFTGEVVGIAFYKYEETQVFVKRDTTDVNGLFQTKWFTITTLDKI